MKIDPENRYILFNDGAMFDLLDVLIYQESFENTLNILIDQHGAPLKASNSPLKIFQQVLGLRRDSGQFVPIGENNWHNLFLIRQDFDYYLAFVKINGERVLVATSDKGMFWNFNVITVDN